MTKKHEVNKLKETPDDTPNPIAEEQPDQKRKKKTLYDWLDVSQWVSYEKLVGNMPFILFLAAIGIIYIANAHLAEKSIRETNEIERKMKQLQWEYTTTKSELEYASKQSEVAKSVESGGLKKPTTPPYKIVTAGNGH